MGKRVGGLSAQSDPQKTEEAVDHRQNNCYVKAVGTSPLQSRLCTPLVAVAAVVWSSHKDNVPSVTVEEQLKRKVVQLSESRSTSLLLIVSKHGA